MKVKDLKKFLSLMPDCMDDVIVTTSSGKYLARDMLRFEFGHLELSKVVEISEKLEPLIKELEKSNEK